MPKGYTAWIKTFQALAKPQLRAQGWKTVEFGPVSITIWLKQKAWRGDADQLIGAIMDALQGEDLAYLDDCQVIFPELRPEITPKDSIEILLAIPVGLSDYALQWICRGELRQVGSRKGRLAQKLAKTRKGK
jgi:Holliday junction resolvase RusA-like endonuclease